MPFTITLAKRDKTTTEDLRHAGRVPAVVYGGDRPVATPVSIALSDFIKLYDAAGESSLVDCTIEGEAPVKVLIQDVQFDPVKSFPTHVDFRQINMNKEMTATVEVVFIGESPAVKELGGTLMHVMPEVDVKCLPKDLVSELSIDLSALKTFDDAVRVKDLMVPAGITIDEDPERVIAKVTPPLTEEELKALEEASAPVDLSAIEVEKKGKIEEENAEGVAAAEEK